MPPLRDWFENYLSAFNRADFDGFGAYYAEDVEFAGQAAALSGRQAVLDFYRQVRSYLDEEVRLITFVGAPDGRRIIAELETRLYAIRDWPEMPTGAMRQGDRRRSIVFAVYDIADGHFARIRTARFARFMVLHG